MEFGVAADNPQSTRCSRPPQTSGHCFNQSSSNAPPDSGLLSLDCTFISGLGKAAETGESSEHSARPNSQNSCVSFSMVKDGGFLGKPTWSGNGVLLPPESFFKGGESSSTLHPHGLRAQVGGRVPRRVDPFLSHVKDFAAGDTRRALLHLENPRRRLGPPPLICPSFPGLMKKVLSLLLSTRYGYSFSLFSF